MSMFDNFTTRGPKLKKLSQTSPWRDDRPTPNSAHRGVYTPRLDVQEKKTEGDHFAIVFKSMPPKKRDTI